MEERSGDRKPRFAVFGSKPECNYRAAKHAAWASTQEGYDDEAPPASDPTRDVERLRCREHRAAAGAGVHTGLFHLFQCFLDGQLSDTRKIVHLNHRERFQVYMRMSLLQSADHFQEMVERKIGVQAAHNVKFRRAFANALRRALVDLFERIGVCAGSVESGDGRLPRPDLRCLT